MSEAASSSRPNGVETISDVMRAPVLSPVIDRLFDTVTADGAWGYRPGLSGSAEPTALACLALRAHNIDPKWSIRALRWLALRQQPDGAVPVSDGVTEPRWPTALAALAWLSADTDAAPAYSINADRAVDWLLNSTGLAFPLMPDTFGHDTTLQGWPWVTDTHSWVEPTAYAIMALRGVGRSTHARTREGITLLLDRTLPSGGWNYGNTRVLTHTLRPFPATTGIALAALAGEPRDARIDASIAYLSNELKRVRAPHSLGWGLIGLAAWDARPDEADAWLDECADRMANMAANGLHDALWLLARSQWHPNGRPITG